MTRFSGSAATLAAATCLAAVAACGDNQSASPDDLTRRAYVVAQESDELTVIDIDTHEIVGQVHTLGLGNHMAELSPDFAKVYVSSPGTAEVIVVDARTLTRTGSIGVGRHPTHMSLSRDGRYLAVVNEEDNAVSFIDPVTDTEVKRIDRFATPHFVRYAADQRTAYVANIGAHHLSVVDLEQLAIVDSIVLDGFAGPPDFTPAPDESGFADAQIAADGMLYAANADAGRVLVYDTNAKAKMAELAVGTAPWIAFAEHPFSGVAARYLVPNFGDATVSLIDGAARSVAATLPGDSEAYGVNFSPLVPDRAYVMNKVRKDIAVVDTASGVITSRIDVGGNTETASTSADGKWIVATVSGANKVVVLDAATGAIDTTLDGVGVYPWSVTIPNGQNYCH